jgi:hypothetical protein
VVANLFDDVVVPVPAQAADQSASGYFRRRSQAAKTN